MARTRRGVLAGVALTVLVALGAGVAVVLGDELGIRSEPADIPAETLVAAPETPAVAPPEFTDDRAAVAAHGPRGRRAARRGRRCGDHGGTATLDVVVGDGDATTTRRTGSRAPPTRSRSSRHPRPGADARRLRPRRRGARPPRASPSTSARRSSRGSDSAWSTSAPSASPSTRPRGRPATTTRTTPRRSPTSSSPTRRTSTRRRSRSPATTSRRTCATRSPRATTRSPSPASSST